MEVDRVHFNDPKGYAKHAGFVAELGTPLIELLEPEPGLRVLDLGCGEGALTLELMASGCEVLGVDSSQEQVEAARARGVDARVMDGEELTFECEFDAVFSNSALHWMKDPDAVIAGVWGALRPGGRFVAEKGGHGNIAAIESALVAGLERRGLDARGANPWYFGHPDDYGQRLEKAGFVVPFMAHFSRPTPLPGDLEDWLKIFGGKFLERLYEDDQAAYLDETRKVLEPRLSTPDGVWVVDYVRLRFLAKKTIGVGARLMSGSGHRESSGDDEQQCALSRPRTRRAF